MDESAPNGGEFGQAYFTTGGTYGKFESQSTAAAQLSRWYAGMTGLLRRLKIDIANAEQPVVEIGCGYGPFLELCGETNTAIIGTDLSMYALGEIRRSHATWPLVAAEATRLPFGSGTVGTVVAFEVLEHLDAPQLTIDEMYRVTRAGGLVVATTPNPLGDILPGIDASKDPTHISVLPPEQWRRRFAAAGFSSTQVITAYQVPYIWRWSRALSMAVQLPVIGPTCVVLACR